LKTAAPTKRPGWTLVPGETPGEISLSGEIDFTSTPAVRDRLLAAMDNPARQITLHLAGLEYIDSSGLALFIEARKFLAETGRTIVIADISPQVRKIFQLTQLSELFGLPE
jgi:anti-sigma B factor antagonist